MKRIACINRMILQNFQIMLKMAMWSFIKGIQEGKLGKKKIKMALTSEELLTGDDN